MGYNKRISYRGIAKNILTGVSYRPDQTFWFDTIGNDIYIFNTRLLEENAVDDVEFVGGLKGAVEVYWFKGDYDGFYVSGDNNRFRVVSIENNNLIAKTLDDYNFDVLSDSIIKSTINATRPVIFYKENDSNRNLIVVYRNDGNFDCYRTDDWITFKRTNLLDMSQRWSGYLLSTSTNVTLEEYLTMDTKILDIYNSL